MRYFREMNFEKYPLAKKATPTIKKRMAVTCTIVFLRSTVVFPNSNNRPAATIKITPHILSVFNPHPSCLSLLHYVTAPYASPG